MLSKTANKSYLRQLCDSIRGNLRRFHEVDIFPQGSEPESLHNPGDIDALRTAYSASEARSTEPDSIGSGNILLQTQLNQPHDLIGEEVHGKGHGTTCGTPATLITEVKVLVTDFRNLPDELTV